jgi:hypothetical protein
MYSIIKNLGGEHERYSILGKFLPESVFVSSEKLNRLDITVRKDGWYEIKKAITQGDEKYQYSIAKGRYR